MWFWVGAFAGLLYVIFAFYRAYWEATWFALIMAPVILGIYIFCIVQHFRNIKKRKLAEEEAQKAALEEEARVRAETERREAEKKAQEEEMKQAERQAAMDRWEAMGNYVVIDTETTGLDPEECDIIEVSAVRFRDWEPVDEFTSLVDPGHRIPQKATDINGITDEMVKGAPSIDEVSLKLTEFIGEDAIVGHNLGFDLDFLLAADVHIDMEYRQCYDTLRIAKRLLRCERDAGAWDFGADDTPVVPNYKLGTLCAALSITHESKHRAAGDCYATGKLFHALALRELTYGNRII